LKGVRSISADDNALFTAVGGRATFLRVDVQDSGATWRDLTSYPGQNLVVSASWHDAVDGNGQNGEIRLKREVEQLSLAPLMQGSPLNLAFAYPGSYAALLQVKRGVRIYTADVPIDTPPSSIASGTWRLMFEGKIDSVDWASTEEIVLAVSDLQGDLRDLFIETERVYAYAQGGNATKGCRIWTPLMTTVNGELSIPTDANRPSPTGHFYGTNGGTSTGSPEPTWPVGSGATVADGSQTWTEKGTTSITAGTAVETVMQQIISDNGGSATLTIPGGSPGWQIKWFLQQRQSLWDALRALTDQIGWDLRYKYDAGSGTFKLCLWTPNRSASTPDRTFGPNEIYADGISQLKVDVASIRNAVQVVFSASGSADPSGNPVRVSVLVTDSTSITKYGRRFMELGEASTSNIDTSAEATTMATAAVSDLKEPNAEKDVSLPYFPFVELGDLYRFSPDAVYADANLDLAIVGYEHSVTADGEATTKLTCRGKPSTGAARWLSQGAEITSDDIHQLAVADHHAVTLSASSVVGGTLLTANGSANKKALGQDFEWHVSTAANFTPDNTTLIQSQGGNQVTVPHLLPNQGYIAKVVPIRRNAMRVVRGMPSADFAFTAGRASAGHLKDGIGLGDYPLNGGFETRLNVAGMPDHWALIQGALGTDVIVKEDGNGISGGRYLRIVGSSVIPAILSAQMPLINDSVEANRLGSMYRFSAWVKNDAGNSTAGQLLFDIQFNDYTGASVGTGGGIVLDVTTNKGHWQRVEAYIDLGVSATTTTKQAQLYILRGSGSFTTDVDECRLQWLGSPWYNVGDTTKFTDAYEALPAFNNPGTAWANFGNPYAPAGFRRDQHGRVWMRGLVKNGNPANSTIFTLPASFRPASNKHLYLPSVSNNLFCVVEIAASGTVTVQAGGNAAHVNLDNMSWVTY
jgi:hypothetical protein